MFSSFGTGGAEEANHGVHFSEHFLFLRSCLVIRCRLLVQSLETTHSCILFTVSYIFHILVVNFSAKKSHGQKIIFCRVLPESPRWLLSQGRYKEAEKILKTMARVNNKSLPENCIESLKKKVHTEQKLKEEKAKRIRYGVTDLFRYPNLRRKTIIITFIWQVKIRK